MTQLPTETTDEIARTVPLTENEYHRLLWAERRRLTIDILEGVTDSVGLDELAAMVAEREDSIDAADGNAIDNVAIDLHHTHLPLLADLGVLDYDPERHRIDPTGVSIDSIRTSQSDH